MIMARSRFCGIVTISLGIAIFLVKLTHLRHVHFLALLRRQSTRDYSRLPDAVVDRALRVCKSHDRRLTRCPLCMKIFECASIKAKIPILKWQLRSETLFPLFNFKMVLEKPLGEGGRPQLWIDDFCDGYNALSTPAVRRNLEQFLSLNVSILNPEPALWI